MNTIAAAAIAILILAGCNHDPCDTPGDMRCSGNVAQLCNAHKHWATYQDCDSAGQTCSTAAADCWGNSDIACCHQRATTSTTVLGS